MGGGVTDRDSGFLGFETVTILLHITHIDHQAIHTADFWGFLPVL